MAKSKTVFSLVLCVQLGFFVLAAVCLAQDAPRNSPDSPIPKEPGWSDPSYRGWELMNITGLVATYYDLNLDGSLDYMVIRKIIRNAPAEGTTVEQAIEIARRDKLSVYISHPVIYYTNKYPLFYCMGVDFRRNCQNIWVDIEEDGLNGNEVLYTLSVPKPLVR
ncbi:MAG: hypothetical protein HY579_02420 [Nitrospinae bacterium]|nr:hypothetical protein [Nitrospinota bacterium]